MFTKKKTRRYWKMLIRNHGYEKVRQFLFLPQRGKFVPKRAAIVHLHEVCFIQPQVWLQTEFTLWQSGSGEGLVWGTHSPVHSSPSSHRLSCWCQKPYVWVFCIDSWWSIFRKQRQSWSPLHIHFLLRRSMLSHKDLEMTEISLHSMDNTFSNHLQFRT